MSISLTDSSTTSETDPDSTTFSLTDPSSIIVTHPELFDPSNSVMDLSDQSSIQSQLSTPSQNGPQTFSITESPRPSSTSMTISSSFSQPPPHPNQLQLTSIAEQLKDDDDDATLSDVSPITDYITCLLYTSDAADE